MNNLNSFEFLSELIDSWYNLESLTIRQLIYLADAATYCVSTNHGIEPSAFEKFNLNEMPDNWGAMFDDELAIHPDVEKRLLLIVLSIKCGHLIFKHYQAKNTLTDK